MITINGIKLRDLDIADLFSRILQENDYTDNIDTLIISSNDRVSIQEPKYTILASNLMLHQINEEFENTIGNNNSSLYNYIQYMVDRGYYSKKLLREYSKNEINVIETFINNSFNYDYDYAGINILNERYLTKDENNKLIETPELMYIVISMMLAIPEQKNKRLEKIKAFYEVTHSRKISLATPILLNLRKNSGNLSSCFPAGQKVLTSKGFINIEDIGVGETVVTRDNTIKSVEKTQSKTYSGDLISLDITKLGKNQLKATAEHPILSIKKDEISCIRGGASFFSNCFLNKGCYEKCFKKPLQYKNDCDRLNLNFNNLEKFHRIDSLSVGDYVAISYPKIENNFNEIILSEYLKDEFSDIEVCDNYLEKINTKGASEFKYSRHVKRVKNKINVDEDFMRLLGYYLSEGYINDNRAVVFTLNRTENVFINDIIELTKKIFDLDVFVNYPKTDNSVRLSIHSQFVAKLFLKLVGTHFNKKMLCDDILYSPILAQKGLLVGLFRGDGCTHNKIMNLVLANQNLMSQIYLLCLRQGLSPTLNHSDKIRKGGTELTSTIILNNSIDGDFIEYVGKNLHKTKQNKSKIRIDRSFWYKGNYYLPISKINKENVSDVKVYDLQVSENHTFNVSYVTVHNCFITSVSDSLLSINHTINSINLISQNAGGVGLNIGRIRAEGSMIGNSVGASSGVMSWVKILDSCITAVNQCGRRRGSITIALPIWHYDFEDFLHCQTENGDLRKKAFNIFPQVIIPDLFMNKLENNDDWFMFCPYEFKKEYNKEINELDKKDFEEYYIKAIENNNIRKRIIKSKELFKKIMKVQLETGLPYIMFRDTTNEVNPNKHDGIIENFNLCMESSSNFKPSKVNSKPNLSNGTNIKQDITSGVAHTCNLVSPNLALIDTDEDIENIITLSVNILDNTIDITETPIPESKLHNEYYRIIGVGALGLADWLAKRKLTYKTGVKQVSELFEKIAYYGIKESIRLAKERGIYPLYEGSEWSKGIVFGKSKDWFENNETVIDRNDWLSLLDDLQQFGIRNGGIFAIAPNCQNPNNKVITKNGVKSIYDILEEQNINYKDIENSKIPQWIQLKNKVEVPTYEGDDYCERIWYNGKQKTVTIEFEDGNIYDFTYNHKLLVNRGGLEVWVRCDELTIYDSIVAQSGYIFIKSIKKEKEMETYDFEIKNNHHYLMENGVVSHNTSSSLLVGATASILPPFAKIFVDKNSKGAVTIIPPHLSQNTMWYYQENKNIPQQYVVDIISEIQEWVDQGISGELFLNIEDEIIKEAKDFYDLLLYCWKKKMKTIYYIRQAKPKTDSGCVSCAN